MSEIPSTEDLRALFQLMGFLGDHSGACPGEEPELDGLASSGSASNGLAPELEDRP